MGAILPHQLPTPSDSRERKLNNLFLCSNPTTGLMSTVLTTALGQNPRDMLHPGPSGEATGAELTHTRAGCPVGPSAVPSRLRQLFRAGGALWDHKGHWGSKGSPLLAVHGSNSRARLCHKPPAVTTPSIANPLHTPRLETLIFCFSDQNPPASRTQTGPAAPAPRQGKPWEGQPWPRKRSAAPSVMYD